MDTKKPFANMIVISEKWRSARSSENLYHMSCGTMEKASTGQTLCTPLVQPFFLCFWLFYYNNAPDWLACQYANIINTHCCGYCSPRLNKCRSTPHQKWGVFAPCHTRYFLHFSFNPHIPNRVLLQQVFYLLSPAKLYFSLLLYGCTSYWLRKT